MVRKLMLYVLCYFRSVDGYDRTAVPYHIYGWKNVPIKHEVHAQSTGSGI